MFQVEAYCCIDRYEKPTGILVCFWGWVAFAPPLEKPPPAVLAALGPQMTALAAARTNGPFPYNVTPEHTARVRAIISPVPWLCVEQKVLLVKDPTKARAVARQAMAFYLPLPDLRR